MSAAGASAADRPRQGGTRRVHSARARRNNNNERRRSPGPDLGEARRGARLQRPRRELPDDPRRDAPAARPHQAGPDTARIELHLRRRRLCQDHRQAGRGLRDPGPGRGQRLDRVAHGEAGLDPAGALHRPCAGPRDGARGVSGNRLSARVRAADQGRDRGAPAAGLRRRRRERAGGRGRRPSRSGRRGAAGRRDRGRGRRGRPAAAPPPTAAPAGPGPRRRGGAPDRRRPAADHHRRRADRPRTCPPGVRRLRRADRRRCRLHLSAPGHPALGSSGQSGPFRAHPRAVSVGLLEGMRSGHPRGRPARRRLDPGLQPAAPRPDRDPHLPRSGGVRPDRADGGAGLGSCAGPRRPLGGARARRRRRGVPGAGATIGLMPPS